MDPLEAWKQLGYRILEIERAAQNVNNLARRINLALVEDVRDMIDHRFEVEGPGWKPLSEVTIHQRRRLGFAAGPILTRSTLLQQGAINGIAAVTADNITLTFKDGPAPKYIGRGRWRRKKINKIRAAAIDKARAMGLHPQGLGASNRLSDYADSLNAVRPFYGAPSGPELDKIIAARNAWIDKVVLAIDSGQSLSSIGLPN